MPDGTDRLYLYEAIELRAEYDARVKTLKGLLPEARENRDRFSFRRDDEVRYRPVPAFRVEDVRDEVGRVEIKRRKLNNAIQRANFDHTVTVDGRAMNLVEALELRKSVDGRIGELVAQLANAAYERVVYKEDRDIVERPEVDYERAAAALEHARRQFRQLNRALRAVAHDVVVDFRDEE
jgi:hypothetical protein